MLKAVVTDINSVDEAQRGFYKEADGKFVLQVTPAEGFELDNVGGLKSALGAERNIKGGLEAKLKTFEGIDATLARQAIEQLSAYGDITPDQAKATKASLEELAKLDPAKEADRLAQSKIEQANAALKAQWTLRETELTSQASALQETLTGLTTQLQTLTRDNEIKSELAKLNPLDDARDAIELLASAKIRTSIKDGQVVNEVLDANGHPRIKDVAGTPFGIADLLAELKEGRPGLFKADQIAGLGTKPGATTTPPAGGQKNPWSTDHWNLTQQAILINTKPDLAKQLKAQAGAA